MRIVKKFRFSNSGDKLYTTFEVDPFNLNKFPFYMIKSPNITVIYNHYLKLIM